MSIKIDLDETQQDHIKRYTDNEGLKMSRAYGELISIRIDHAEEEDV